MREPTQETILAAYIAAGGKPCPSDAARDASELCSITRSPHPQSAARIYRSSQRQAKGREGDLAEVALRSSLARTFGGPKSNHRHKREVPFVTSVPLEEAVLPEPNSPVRPEEFRGRSTPIEAFRQCPRQGLLIGRTPSFAVLGDSGIGKSSLLLKFTATCSESGCRMLPVFLSVSDDLGDYLRFAENPLDQLAETLARPPCLAGRLRSEVQNWKLKRISLAGFQLDREASPFFLSSGSGLLRHTLAEAWERFLRPAHINGAIFFPDDLHNLASPSPEAVALALRDQFQSFAIEGLNSSACFSARADYFSGVRSFAEPAVRFCEKVYLAPSPLEETNESVRAVFASHPDNTRELAEWLYEKTLGHPYFLAFLSRQLPAQTRGSPAESPARHWPEIFRQSEREKFRTNLAQLSEKDSGFLHAFAKGDGEEFAPRQVGQQFDRVYFRRLTGKGLLVRAGRGRYKLCHPLFKLFLQGPKA